MFTTCRRGQNERAYLVPLLMCSGKGCCMVSCSSACEWQVRDSGPLRPRLPEFCPWRCFPHTSPVLVSGTESWGCGRDEWTMCPVHLCPNAQHSAWHRAALHKCLQNASQKPPPLVSRGDLGLALSRALGWETCQSPCQT